MSTPATSSERALRQAARESASAVRGRGGALLRVCAARSSAWPTLAQQVPATQLLIPAQCAPLPLSRAHRSLPARAVRGAIQPGRTKLVMLESPTNPRMTICDIRAIADMAHAAGALVSLAGAALLVHSSASLPACRQTGSRAGRGSMAGAASQGQGQRLVGKCMQGAGWSFLAQPALLLACSRHRSL